jgi:hypothetical protein
MELPQPSLFYAQNFVTAYHIIKGDLQPDENKCSDLRLKSFMEGVEDHGTLQNFAYRKGFREHILNSLNHFASKASTDMNEILTDKNRPQFRECYNFFKQTNDTNFDEMLTAHRLGIYNRNPEIIATLTSNADFQRALESLRRKNVKVRMKYLPSHSEDRIAQEIEFRFCYVLASGLKTRNKLQSPAKSYTPSPRALRLAQQLINELDGVHTPSIFDRYITELANRELSSHLWKIPHTSVEIRNAILLKMGDKLKTYFVCNGTKKGRPYPDVLIHLLFGCGFQIDLRQANRVLAKLDDEPI